MILLRSFIRKKANKIYLIILIILLILIITISSFINHYASIVNEIFEKSSYIVVSSKNNYYDMIKKYKSVTSIKRILLVKPDYSYNVLGREGYEIRNKYGILIDSRKPEENLRINWEDFTVSGSKNLNGSILIFSANDMKLKDNQIDLGMQSNLFTYSYYYKDIQEIINDLIGKKIGFYNDKTKLEFTINRVYKSYFPEMKIPKHIFKTITTNTNVYTYYVLVNDFREAKAMVKRLEKLESIDNGDFIVTLNQNYYNEDSQTSTHLQDLIYNLSLISNLIIFIFSIIFFIVIKNTIKEIKINKHYMFRLQKN